MTRKIAAALAVLVPTLALAATTDELAKKILDASGTKGLCLDIAAGSGELAAAVARGSEMTVHALAPDDAALAAARRTMDATGLYAVRISAEKGSPARLPYPDTCANLVIRGDLLAEGAPATAWAEVLRVLRPGGLAYIGWGVTRPSGVASEKVSDTFSPKREEVSDTATPEGLVTPIGHGGGSKLTAADLRAQLAAAGIRDAKVVEEDGVWVSFRRPPLAGTFDWSHGGEGSPGNNPCAEDDRVRAPFQTLWIGGPTGFTKYGYPLLSAGRVLLRHGGITHDSRWKMPREGDLIQAFDAYNGIALWQRRLGELAGEGFVAVDESVYAAAGTTLYVLNAADGAIRARIRPQDVAGDMKDWADYARSDGVLVVSLYDAVRDYSDARDPRVPRVLAGLSAPGEKVLWQLRPEGGVGSIALGDGRVFYVARGKYVASLDIATGREKWRAESRAAGLLRYYRGRLYCDAGVFAGTDGRLVGSNNPRGILVGDRCYGGGMKGIGISDIQTGQRAAGLVAPHDPYCPKTGIPAGCRYMYGRCIRTTASTHCYFFSYSGTVIGDLLTDTLFPTEAFRSNCRTGVIAGGGLVYNSPSGCGCALAVRGGAALVPVAKSFYAAAPDAEPQLEKGPAYDRAFAAKDAPDDWPACRHDAARSGVTPAKLAGPMQQKWRTQLGGPLTPPAIVGGMVFVGSDDHSVYALDAASGAVRWRFRTGGEVHVTPAVWAGRVYAGSQDGWLYCLAADDGALVWRFRGGPHDRKMVFRGRVQSLWPIGGGAIVADGVANFYAGYCSHDRVFLYATDARTGAVLWVNDAAGRAVDVTGPAGGISPHGVSPAGPVVASKDMIYVANGMFAPAAFDRPTGRLLWWGRRGDSTQRSNINVQNYGGPILALGGGLLFVGGANRLTGSSQPFVAVDAKTGRFWGADDPRLAEKAARGPNGESLNVERSSFGTHPIRFGDGVAPVVADGGVFISGYRGGFRDLAKYLETQFGPAAGSMDKWPVAAPAGSLAVTADAVLACGGSTLAAVRRTDGGPMWSARLTAVEGGCIPNGLATTATRAAIVTDKAEVIGFGR